MGSATTPTRYPDRDSVLVDALRAGDEAGFRTLVRRYQTPMIAVALRYVHDRALAEDVVQETWVALLEGLDRFEGQSSVKTWLFAVLVNRARSDWRRQVRTVPGLDEGGWAAVDHARFRGADDPLPGHWAQPPTSWHQPVARVEAGELRRVVGGAIRRLPAGQQAVITLRDVEGWSAAEVCETLDLTPGNQRVLLHRARSQVRAALDTYLAGGG